MGKPSPSYSQRELSEEELQLFETQSQFLDQAMEISSAQFNLSEEDREYFNEIYRGELNKNDPKVKEEVAKRLEGLEKPTLEQFKSSQTTTTSTKDSSTNVFDFDDDSGYTNKQAEDKTVTEEFTDREAYEAAMAEWDSTVSDITRAVQQDLGSVSIDEMLFDAVKSASPKTNELMDNWYNTAKNLGSDYINKIEGLSEEFKTRINESTDTYKSSIKQSETKYVGKMESSAAKYTTRAEDIAGKMGTADDDIYARAKGENLAGISQAYQEAMQQSQANLARRGLAGTGVEAGVASLLLGQEARDKATALSSSYVSAIDQSDARRTNQLGIYGSVLGTEQGTAQNVFSGEQQVAGSTYNADTTAAQNVYSSGMDVAGKSYQTQLATETSNLQNQLAGQAQDISNLGMLSGISQGVYSGSQNYLSNAGSTAIGGANSAGSTFGTMFTSNNTAAAAQAQASADSAAGIGSLVGTLGGAYAGTASGSAAMTKLFSSDIRFKNDIQFVKTKNGINIYTWDWNEFAYEYLGEDELYEPIGVLAQEVKLTHPEYVFEDESGFMVVDYKGLSELIGETYGV